MDSQSLPNTAKKNVELMARAEQQFLIQRSNMEKFGVAIAHFFGNLNFIIAHCLFFTGWFVVNLDWLPTVRAFDPYPFPFLGLIVGIEFIFLTTFVLMNQNSQSSRQEQWSHLVAQLAMLTEYEVTKNMQLLQAICKHLDINGHEEREVNDLVQTTHVATLIEEIAHKLSEVKKSGR